MGGGKQERDDLDKMQSPVAAEIKHGFETEREDEEAVGLHSDDQIDDHTYIQETAFLASNQMNWIARDIAAKLTKLKDEIARKENLPWYTRLAEGILEHIIPLGLSSGAKALSTLVVESNYSAKTPRGEVQVRRCEGAPEVRVQDAADAGVSQIKGALTDRGKALTKLSSMATSRPSSTGCTISKHASSPRGRERSVPALRLSLSVAY